MPELIPVDYNPFESSSPKNPTLIPVQGNPFQQNVKPVDSASMPMEILKYGARGIIGAGEGLNNTLQGIAGLGGRLIGVKPEDNMAYKFFQPLADEYATMRQGYNDDMAKGINNGTITPVETPFTKNEQWAKTHPVTNFIGDQVEGAIPYVIGGMATGGALPLAAALSTHDRLTRKGIAEGEDSDLAMQKAALPAITEGALFAAMHGAKNYMMGSKAPVSSLVDKTVSPSGTFVPGKAVDLLNKVGMNGMASGLEKEAGGALGRIGREAAFVGPYLHGQGEAVQGAELLSGTMNQDEYNRAHGYDPNKGAMDNLASVGLAQLKGLGTSALVGAGFGATAELSPSAIRQRKLLTEQNAFEEGRRLAAESKAQKDLEIEESKKVGVTTGKESLSVLGDSPTVEQILADQKRNGLKDINENEFNNEVARIDNEENNLNIVQNNLASSDLLNRGTGDSADISSLDTSLKPSPPGGPLLKGSIPQNSDLSSVAEMTHPVNEEGNVASETPVHPVVQKATEAVNKAGGILDSDGNPTAIEPSHLHRIVSAIYQSAKNFTEFSKEIVSQFGESVKQHALKLYNVAKQQAQRTVAYAKSKFAEERGSFSTKPVLQSENDLKSKVTPEPVVSPSPSDKVDDLGVLRPQNTVREDKDSIDYQKVLAEQTRKEKLEMDKILPVVPHGSSLESEMDRARLERGAEIALEGRRKSKEDMEADASKSAEELAREKAAQVNKIVEPKLEEIEDEQSVNEKYYNNRRKGAFSQNEEDTVSEQQERGLNVSSDNDRLDMLNRAESVANKLVDKRNISKGSQAAALDSYNGEVKREVNTFILKLKKNPLFREKMTGDLAHLTYADYLGSVLRQITSLKDITDTTPFAIKSAIRHINKEMGDVSELKEAPQALWDLAERYKLRKEGTQYDPETTAMFAEKTLVEENKGLIDGIKAATEGMSKQDVLENKAAFAAVLKNPRKFVDFLDSLEMNDEGEFKRTELQDSTDRFNAHFKADITHDALDRLATLFNSADIEKLIPPKQSEELQDIHKGMEQSLVKPEKNNVTTTDKEKFKKVEAAAQVVDRKKSSEDAYESFKKGTEDNQRVLDTLPKIFKAIADMRNEHNVKAFGAATPFSLDTITNKIYQNLSMSEMKELGDTRKAKEQIRKDVADAIRYTELSNGTYELMLNDKKFVNGDIETLKDIMNLVVDKLGQAETEKLFPEFFAKENAKPALSSIDVPKYTAKAVDILRDTDGTFETGYTVAENIDVLHSDGARGNDVEITPVDTTVTRPSLKDPFNVKQDKIVSVTFRPLDREGNPQAPRTMDFPLENIEKMKLKYPDLIINKVRNNGKPVDVIRTGKVFQDSLKENIEQAQKAFEAAKILDKDFFEKQAQEFSDAGMSPAEHYQMFLETSGDKQLYQTRVNRIVEERNNDKAREAYITIRQARAANEKQARDIATNGMLKSLRDSYEKYLEDVADRKSEKKESTYSTADQRAYFEAVKKIEDRILAGGLDEQTSIATDKEALGLTPSVPDYFKESDTSTADNQFGVRQVGSLSNRLADAFYKTISKMFGADLVLVSDDNYKSRYVPANKSKDGKAKLVININSHTNFSRVYAHELFHHVVAKASPEAYEHFRTALEKTVDKEVWNKVEQSFLAKGLTLEEAREEIHAEIFSKAFTQRAFWNGLATTLEGRTLAGKIMTRLIERFGDVYHKMNRAGGVPIIFEQKQLINAHNMSEVFGLMNDLLGAARRSTITRETDVKFHTQSDVLNDTLKGLADEVKGGMGAGKVKLGEAYHAVFPVGSKGYKEVMTAIEGLVDKANLWIKEHKPKNVFADFMADPEQARLAGKLAFEFQYDTDSAKAEIVAKYKDVWKGLTTEQLETLHDNMVRNRVNVGTIKNPNEAGIAKAKKIGLSDDQIKVFQEYKRVADEIHEKLVKIYPDLEKIESHYGQSIKWFKEDGTVLDDSFDRAVNPEFSKLEGNKQFLKEMSAKRTAQLKEKHGLTYTTIDPHEMFLQYVGDASKLIHLKEMIDEGMDAKDPSVKMFTDQYKAAAEKYFPVNDNGTKLFQRLDLPQGYKVKIGDEYYQSKGADAVYATKAEAEDRMSSLLPKGDQSHISVEAITPEKKVDTYFRVDRYVEGEEKPVNAGEFKTQKQANDFIQKQTDGAKYDVQKFDVAAKSVQTGQLYFKQDLARMINVLLSDDKIRGHALGRAAMNLKNMSTSLEFALSYFHAMTIGQEMTASYAGWNLQRHNKQGLAGKFKGFNPSKAMNESKQISTLLQAVMQDKNLATNEAVLNKAKELLGTDNLDILDMLKQFYSSGGIMHMDKDLRSSVHNLGSMKYTNKPMGMEVRDGKVVFTNNDLGAIEGTKDFASAVKESVSSVWSEQLVKNDSKLKGLFNSVSFTALEAPTAWLMEQGIPMIKMAQFAREYTLALDKNKAKIDLGLTTRDAIARDTMKFINDRFGEVNWKTMWMDNSIKTGLQFLFRSFTWFTGSWKALGKAGIDVGKLGWFTLKGEGIGSKSENRYHLTEKGAWGVTAILTHFMTAGLITAAYSAMAAVGGDEVPDDPETPFGTKLMFPRIDRYDPTKRLTVPSYVSEGYKIMLHLGMLGSAAEPTKLISGRMNSLISNAIETCENRDFRGVTVRDADDSLPRQAVDSVLHLFKVAPISFSTMFKENRDKGLTLADVSTGLLGMTDAPAAAKRSDATNLAFEIRRKENPGKEISPEKMEEKDALKRAMYAYEKGDKSKIDSLLAEGRVSQKQYEIALTRIPLVNGKPNPKYKNQLTQAIQGLTMEGALRVWDKMSDSEKSAHRGEMMKKYMNMNARKDKSDVEKTKIRSTMKEYGLI